MRSPALFLAAALVAGCGKGNGTPAPAPSGSAAASGSASVEGSLGVPIGGPFPVEKVVAAVNPAHKPPYAGPKGTLKGTVRIDGDPPPDTDLKFPDKCKDSTATYGKLFRVGLDKALADTLVAVTEYGDRGFVPAADEAIKVTIHRCVPQKRTVALTFGQRIEVSNLDKLDSYLPYLDGTPTRTVMVAVPEGAPVKLYPAGPSPSHYMLRDQLGSGLVADVFIVNYATIDVTGLDGQYEIKGIPVGKVRVERVPAGDRQNGGAADRHQGGGQHARLQPPLRRRSGPPQAGGLGLGGGAVGEAVRQRAGADEVSLSVRGRAAGSEEGDGASAGGAARRARGGKARARREGSYPRAPCLV